MSPSATGLLTGMPVISKAPGAVGCMIPNAELAFVIGTPTLVCGCDRNEIVELIGPAWVITPTSAGPALPSAITGELTMTPLEVPLSMRASS